MTKALPPTPPWLPGGAELRAQMGGGALSDSFYRVQLATYVACLLPLVGECVVLDVGCGEGRLGGVIARHRPGTEVIGVDTFIRPGRMRWVDIVGSDGSVWPFRDNAVDVALLLNVLHHATRPGDVLREVCRVARKRVIVKDHLAASWLQHGQLALLDVLGNAGSGAVVRGHYLSAAKWADLFASATDCHVWQYTGLAFRKGLLEALFPNALEVMFTLELEERE